jgi:hypothetical protein
MISGHWGLSLNILSIISVGVCASLIFTSAAVLLISHSLQRFHANAKRGILWSVVVLPWPISLLSVGLLTFPEFSQTRETWLSSFAHWHHIDNFEILSWHGASTWTFSLIFIGVCITKIHKAFKASAKLSQLDFFVENTTCKQGLIVIESVQCQAFTAGLVRPRSYITSGLRDHLTQQEVSVVAAHELAHARTHDPLKKYVVSLFAAFFPKSIAQQINGAFSLALEQIADQSALLTVNDETIVSNTLLKVSQLTSQYVPKLSVSTCHFSTHPLTLRIRYLLSDNKGQSFPILLFCSFAALTTALSTLSVDLLHHALEQLFTH